MWRSTDGKDWRRVAVWDGHVFAACAGRVYALLAGRGCAEVRAPVGTQYTVQMLGTAGIHQSCRVRYFFKRLDRRLGPAVNSIHGWRPAQPLKPGEQAPPLRYLRVRVR